MKHRPGITLVEVLVSIFIMGIGMIALLTLFPLGAVNVAQALRDDRAAQAAANASACALARDLRHDASAANEFERALDDIDPAYRSAGPSSPVYVDPFGTLFGAGNLGVFGNPNTPGVRRVSPDYVNNAPVPDDGSTPATRTVYWFSLLDDLNFDLDGRTTKSGSAAVERGGRYNWAYLLRRARADSASVVEMAVVVYCNRPVSGTTGETAYAATGKFGQYALTIDYAVQKQAKPRFRVGSWVLDSTKDATGVVRGYFYKIVDVQDVGNTSIVLELSQPLKAGPNVDPPGAPTAYAIVALENVVEVFERGTGWRP